MKRIKLYEEFLSGAEPQIAPSKPKTAPPKTDPKTKPNRPSPIRRERPGVDPAPKATTSEVIDRYADELDNLDDDQKEEYFKFLKRKYS